MDYYLLTADGQQAGPYGLSQLRSFWADGKITRTTLYWTQGMADWLPVSNIETLIVPAPPPPRPAPSPPPVAPVQPTKAPRKGLGCGQGCLVLGIAAFCGLLLLLVYGAAHEGDPQPNVGITGTTARCHWEIPSGYTSELAGETVAEEVYNVAATYPQLTEIDMELELSVPGGLVDTYGHAVAGPYIMGTLRVNDLGEVRKYATAGSFGIAVQDAYAIRIMALSYANQLKQE